RAAVPARPGAPLAVAAPEFLLAVLVEALDRPPRVGPADPRRPRDPVEAPGEGPLRLAGAAGQRALADRPALRPGDVAVRAVDPGLAHPPPARPPLTVEHRHRPPAARRRRRGPGPRAVQWREPDRLRLC